MKRAGDAGGSDGLRIRRARLADAGAIARVLYKSFVEFETRYTPPAFAATAACPQAVGQRLCEGPVWLAWQGGAAVGTVAVTLRGFGAYVRGMGVIPRARGLGLGKRLLEQAEQYALQKRSPRLFLSTTPFLERAILLYESCGFLRRDGGSEDLFGTPLITMIKDLEKGKGTGPRIE